MTSAFASAVQGCRPRKVTGYVQQAGNLLDNWTNTYNQATWATANSGGTATAPTAAAPYVTLTTGPSSGNFGKIRHRSPWSFTGLSATDTIVIDIEFIGTGPEGGAATGTINDGFSVTFSNDNYTVTSMTWAIGWQRYMESRICLAFTLADMTQSGGATTLSPSTVFNYMDILYKRGNGGTAGLSKTLIVRGIYVQSKARPKIIVEYDKGLTGVYNYAFPLHTQYNIPGTVNVTRGDIFDNGGYPGTGMTVANLQTLYAAGWDMSMRNGPTHDTFTDLPSLTAEMSAARQWNTDRGLIRGADHCIYPVGIMTALSRPALQAAGILSARTTHGLPMQTTTEVGKTDMYCLPTCGFAGTASVPAFAACKSAIDKTISMGKSMIMYTHDIGQGDTIGAGGVSQNDLAAILQYLAQQRDSGLVDLVTKTQWYNGLFA